MNAHRSQKGVLPQHVQDVSLDINYDLSSETKPSLKLSAKLAKWLR